MEPDIRASLAYIAGCLSTKQYWGSVYDQGQGRHMHVTGQFTPFAFTLFLHACGTHLRGQKKGDGWQVFEYRENRHFYLETSGPDFKGFDYRQSAHFAGCITGTRIRFFDYEQNAAFQYVLSVCKGDGEDTAIKARAGDR